MARGRLAAVGAFVIGGMLLFAVGLFMIGSRRMLFGGTFKVVRGIRVDCRARERRAWCVSPGCRRVKCETIQVPAAPSADSACGCALRDDLRPLDPARFGRVDSERRTGRQQVRSDRAGHGAGACHHRRGNDPEPRAVRHRRLDASKMSETIDTVNNDDRRRQGRARRSAEADLGDGRHRADAHRRRGPDARASLPQRTEGRSRSSDRFVAGDQGRTREPSASC